MVKMDITDIQYSDNSFDVILCSHVLEHIMDDHKALSELFRVLKPGGRWTIIQVPIFREKTFEDPLGKSPEERQRFFGQYDHVRSYGRDFKDQLEAAGFSVKVNNYTKKLSDRKVEFFGLRKNKDIYFCRKIS